MYNPVRTPDINPKKLITISTKSKVPKLGLKYCATSNPIIKTGIVVIQISLNKDLSSNHINVIKKEWKKPTIHREVNIKPIQELDFLLVKMFDVNQE